ncbi:MAG: class I SAM-dependent methyltransferase [Mycobacterium sp.]|nr:class I SAM-dependent methyltransferase [Mycobacterium sp.]
MRGLKPSSLMFPTQPRWIAAYRATESARSDALFDDPLADRLAGEHGHAIVAAAPPVSWALVARTKLIDDIVIKAIDEGCDRVLNLAAGLDTRPYRLDLPSDFAWVEADLPTLLAEKEQSLLDRTPRCDLTRWAVDLADPVARDEFLEGALAGAKQALVLTEGLLMYLEPCDIAALSQAFRRPPIAWWLLEFWGAGLKKWMTKKTDAIMTNAPFKFGPENGVAYFEDLGWSPVETEPILHAAHRFRRLPFPYRFAAYLPQPDPRNPGNKRWSAVTRLAPRNR